MTSNGFLDRAAFLAKKDRRYTTVDLPTGGTLRLQSLTERERSGYEAWMLNKKGDGADPKKLVEFKRKMVVLCAVDAEGKRLLNDSDMDAMAHMDSADIDAACTAARKHCKFDDEDFESLVGNSESVPADASPSA